MLTPYNQRRRPGRLDISRYSAIAASLLDRYRRQAWDAVMQFPPSAILGGLVAGSIGSGYSAVKLAGGKRRKVASTPQPAMAPTPFGGSSTGLPIKNMPYRRRYKKARRYRRRRKRRRNRQMAKLNYLTSMVAPLKHGYYTAHDSIASSENKGVYSSFDTTDQNSASMAKLVHRSTDQMEEIYDYYIGSATSYEGTGAHMWFNDMTTTYTFLNPGNTPIIVDYWLVTPKRNITDGPYNFLNNALSDTTANPATAAGVRTQADITDFQFWPEQLKEWKKAFKVYRKGKFALGPDQTGAVKIFSKNFKVEGNNQGTGYVPDETKFCLAKVRGIVGSVESGGVALIGYTAAQADVMITTSFSMRIIPTSHPVSYGRPQLGGTAPNVVAPKVYTGVNGAVLQAKNA